MSDSADVIIVGAGLSGLVAAVELADAGKRVVIVDQEPEQNLGGQAYWSFGGLFLVDSPEQRCIGIRDSYELALDDWMQTAGFDRPEDVWPRKWAEAYVAFAAGEKRSWLHARGLRWFRIVEWAERGGHGAVAQGNSVPRFHVTWGTGPAVVEAFARRAREAEKSRRIAFKFRHRVDGLSVTNGVVDGVSGAILEPSTVPRAVPSSRVVTEHFELKAQAVIIASGGIGGNHALVRRYWPPSLGPAPGFMLQGVPDFVDGRMVGIAEAAGAKAINHDRMWCYATGLRNWKPIWSNHGVAIDPGPSVLWLDATGKRLPSPLFPGFDTRGALEFIRKTGYDYSWFVLNQLLLKREIALSGSEQNLDFTNRRLLQVVLRAFGKKATVAVEAFKTEGKDFVVRTSLADLVAGMNALTGEPLLSLATVEHEVTARDRQLNNKFGKDLQFAAVRQARNYWGDWLSHTSRLRRLLAPEDGPLIAIKLNIMPRKTLGGLQTDLSGRVFRADEEIWPGLYAAGEAAGFGGGGVHGYRALEGTFLGGCIFSGRAAGRAAAAAVV